MDPPDHTRIRRLVSQAFTPRRVADLREPVRRTAAELLDAVAPDGRADLIAAYAAPLPIRVICDLLGVAPGDRRDFRGWTDALVAPDPSRPSAAKEAVAAMLAYFGQLIARKRAHPEDDLLSAMIAARDDGDRLSEDELMSLTFLVLFAGYENTVQLIGNAVLALLTHPAQLAALRAEPGRTAAAVEELTRWDGPAPLAIRRFPWRTSPSAASRSPPGRRCCCRWPRPTETPPVSRSPTGSMSAAPTPRTSASGTASTTASARPWPGWRPRSRSPDCWPVSPGSPSTPTPRSCGGAPRCVPAA